MKLSRYFLLAVLALAAALQGCKEKEDAEYKYLDGNLSLPLPLYVEPGFSKAFLIDTLMVMSRDDKGTIGYYVFDSGTGVYDTLVTADGKFRHHDFVVAAPDAITSRTVSLTAFTETGSEYYNSTVSSTYTVVRPGLDGKGSITRFEPGESDIFTDARDGRKYYVLDGGKLRWMRFNLCWEGAGVPYMDCAAMNDIFGRYYTWEEAQTACPEGWRLPTDAEWTALDPSAEAGKDIAGLAGKVMGDLYFNGTKMWEYWREVKITDQLGISAMPAGYAKAVDGSYSFDGLYTYAAFWTADESDGLGVCRYIFHNKDIVYRGRLSKTDFAASVRCVADVTP